MSKAVLERLAARFPEAVVSSHSKLGNDTAVLHRDALHEAAAWLRDDADNQMDLFRDVTVVDRLQLGLSPRFEVVYHLYSLRKKHGLRLKVELDEADLTVPTLSDLWPAANWPEREAWDMYGVRFGGHPDLRRLLLYDEFEGHPLRKDYDKRKSQPRCDLLAPERDAISEYRAWQAEHTEPTP